MRKIHVLGVALFAALALSAVASSSAFAVSKVLLNNAEITTKIPFSVESDAGNLLLEDMGATGKPDILCSGFFDGTIEPGGVLAFLEGVLTLTGENKANSISCVSDNGTCEGAVIVTALNLPWHLEVVLATIGGVEHYLLHFLSGTEEANKMPAYSVDCLVFGLLFEDVCQGLTFADLTENSTEGDLLGVFSENTAITPAGNCSEGGVEQGLLFGDGLITSTSGPLELSP
jgi:hypothetical protein